MNWVASSLASKLSARGDQLHVPVELEQAFMSKARRRLGDVVVQVVRIKPIEVFGDRHDKVGGRSGRAPSEYGARDERGGEETTAQQS